MTSTLQCHLCPRECRLQEGQRGDCRVRINLDGELQSLVYGNPCSVHVDPIEKKPLFHVLPTSQAFSIATAGCNLHCKFCQNWQISQRPPEETHNLDLPPDAVVASALRYNCRSIAYTYSEPIVFYEYTYDTSKLAKAQGLLNVLVTAGYIQEKPLRDLCPYIDAANVDLKGITEKYYRKMCRATLKPVQEAIKTMVAEGVFVELTNLVVPTWNDRKEDFVPLCRWIVDNLGPDIPIHFSRFWPQHQLKNLPPTPLESLDLAWEIAQQEGLHYAYVGNVPAHKGNNTYCHHCGQMLIKRAGYEILENNFVNGKCPTCGTHIPGIWE